jgi:hypothetical protein
MILIQCTKSKHDRELPARELYEASDLFSKSRTYAELQEDDWAILSAKHGLVNPDEILEPYDEFGIDPEQAEEIAMQLDSAGVDKVKVLAGKKYVDPLTPELEVCGIEVIEPMRGLQFGERLSWLNTKIKELENKSITNA